MHIPIIDWPLCKELAGNNINHAKEFLKLFVDDLNRELIIIKQTYALKNYSELQNLLHRMRGALCYTGLPRLSSATNALEQAVIQKFELTLLIEKFIQEAEQVIMYLNQPHHYS